MIQTGVKSFATEKMDNQAWWSHRRWSIQVHPTSSFNPHKSVQQFATDSSRVESVREGYIGLEEPAIVELENDAVIAALTDESGFADEATSDRQRLLNRLELYDQDELKIVVVGDGNCQFRSLSDQLYRSPEYHKSVRRHIVDQLKAHPELYAPYIPMAYNEYLRKISKLREWGDHVTLQAAADWYGIKINVLTSYKNTCYIEILPHLQKSQRVIFLSFRAEEVHYNSIYPKGELARKKKWWNRLK